MTALSHQPPRYLIPDEAAPHVASGLLDRRLFDLTYLAANGYTDGTVWLDAKVEAFDDVGNAQIGAPRAWAAAGHDGTGATVGVIDTGVDRTHPDLASQVVAARNFVEAGFPGGGAPDDDTGRGPDSGVPPTPRSRSGRSTATTGSPTSPAGARASGAEEIHLYRNGTEVKPEYDAYGLPFRSSRPGTGLAAAHTPDLRPGPRERRHHEGRPPVHLHSRVGPKTTGLRDLKVWTSPDGGTRWTRATVSRGKDGTGHQLAHGQPDRDQGRGHRPRRQHGEPDDPGRLPGEVMLFSAGRPALNDITEHP